MKICKNEKCEARTICRYFCNFKRLKDNNDIAYKIDEIEEYIGCYFQTEFYGN